MLFFVFIPLILFPFLLLNPLGLDSNQSCRSGIHYLIFKKYDSKKYLPDLLIEELVDSDDYRRIYSRQFILANDPFP